MKESSAVLEKAPKKESPKPAVRSIVREPAPVTPAGSSAAPKTSADVLALHSTYGNAAVAQAASAGTLSPVPPPSPAAAKFAPAAAPASSASTPDPAASGSVPPPVASGSVPAPPGKSSPQAPAQIGAPVMGASQPAAKGQPGKTEKSDSDASAGGDQKSAARSPVSDPAFAAVVHRVKSVASHQKTHAPAKSKAAEAHSAAVSPPNEVSSLAAARQTETMSEQKPKPFNREAFKAALRGKIKAPKTLEEADDFKEKNNLGEVKAGVNAEVAQGKADSQGALPQTVAAPPNAAGIEATPHTTLPPADAGAAQTVAASGVAPKSATAQDIALDPGPKAVDKEMASAKVTEEQLSQSNEPAFQSALGDKKSAEADAASAPDKFRAQEKTMLHAAQAEAQATAAGDTAHMHASRLKAVHAVAAHQDAAKAEEEKQRREIYSTVEEIYKSTKDKVTNRLEQLDHDVNTTFDTGATNAQNYFENYVDVWMTAYKDERYSGWTGGAKWLKDKLVGLPDDVDKFYQRGHDLYLKRMDAVIDQVAGIVETGLNEAQKLIADGKAEIQKYLSSLSPKSQETGKKAAEGIQNKFEALEQSVTEKQDQLVDSLAQKYTDNLQKVNDRIEEMKEANKGLVAKAVDAVKGVIKTILELKDMLFSVLAKAGSVIDMIIGHPIAFLGNLVDAGKLGFSNFVDHREEHLKKGFMDFLFGELSSTGIELPKDFDLPGIFSLVMQVLGLTYSNIRARAVNILGERVVKALETGAEIFKILMTKGPMGLWEYVKDKIGDLKGMVIEKILAFITEKVIVAGITWIIGLLNPAAAFIKACKAIYDIVMFFVDNARRILELVNSILDSIGLIAKGNITSAAAYVENSMARSVPVMIGFLAGLLGVGGIAVKIKSIIAAIRKPVNEAIDWVIHKAVSVVKAVGGVLGFGKKDEKEEKHPAEKTEGEIDVPVVMDGTQHELSAAPGPDPVILLASKERGDIAGKIETAKKKIPESEKKQHDDLEKLKVLARNAAHLQKDPKDKTKADAALSALKTALTNYGTDYNVKNLQDVGDLFPVPEYGTYKDMTAKGLKDKLPDGKIREAHHAPQVQFAESLVQTLRNAGRGLGEEDEGTGEALKEASKELKEETTENDLPSILVHQDTHRTHGGKGEGGRIHGSEIREELDALLATKEESIKDAIPKTAAGEIAVKPGAATYRRQMRRVANGSIRRALKDSGPKLVQTVYDAERERSFGAVQIAVKHSNIDGREGERMSVVSSFFSYAKRKWDGFISRVKSKL